MQRLSLIWRFTLIAIAILLVNIEITAVNLILDPIAQDLNISSAQIGHDRS